MRVGPYNFDGLFSAMWVCKKNSRCLVTKRPDGKFCTFGACDLPSDCVFSHLAGGPVQE